MEVFGGIRCRRFGSKLPCYRRGKMSRNTVRAPYPNRPLPRPLMHALPASVGMYGTYTVKTEVSAMIALLLYPRNVLYGVWKRE